MKCDELKRIESDRADIVLSCFQDVYEADSVDAAIAELKDKCQMHDFFWEGCGFAKRGFKNSIAVSEAFDKLEAENAELKEERRWRNLKDEQPQEGERVLIVDEYFQDISMAMYTDDHCWELNSGATILTTAFPYWMPLPSAPKEGK